MAYVESPRAAHAAPRAGSATAAGAPDAEGLSSHAVITITRRLGAAARLRCALTLRFASPAERWTSPAAKAMSAVTRALYASMIAAWCPASPVRPACPITRAPRAAASCRSTAAGYALTRVQRALRQREPRPAPARPKVRVAPAEVCLSPAVRVSRARGSPTIVRPRAPSAANRCVSSSDGPCQRLNAGRFRPA